MTHGTATAHPHVSRVASHTSHASHASHAGAEFAYPHGHLGALSEHEEEALAKFKVLLEEKGYWKPGPRRRMTTQPCSVSCAPVGGCQKTPLASSRTPRIGAKATM
uniref:Uncharacterized protein n=1 Tax=Bionectria ochroleuca TaxID=29856 RepID=A0A8H7N3T8_BIOOC